MYVAAKGGEEAIQRAETLYRALNGTVTPALVAAIRDSLPYLVDRVMGEGSLYAPDLAALALAQTGGDVYEAVLLLRAYRSTQPRIAYAAPVTAADLFTVRRISAAFKDIPGGQVLGPTLDYSHRILDLDALDGTGSPPEPAARADQPAPRGYPAVADWLRAQGLMETAPLDTTAPGELPDVTTDPILFPAPRAHRLQALARSETGGTLALGYASMRGYGLIHPTVNELRLGYAEVGLTHPLTGEAYSAGRVRMSFGEVVNQGGSSDKSGFSLGFTATLGWNEVKLIAGATLDLEMNAEDPHPAHAEEFVLYHTEPVEASGFCIHFKLPHYVTFASNLDAVRRVGALLYGEKESSAPNGASAHADPIVGTHMNASAPNPIAGTPPVASAETVSAALIEESP